MPVGRKGIKKGVCSSEKEERRVILKKKKSDKKYRGYLLWILDDDSGAKTDQDRFVSPIIRIQYPPCIREISSSLFFYGQYKAGEGRN